MDKYKVAVQRILFYTGILYFLALAYVVFFDGRRSRITERDFNLNLFDPDKYYMDAFFARNPHKLYPEEYNFIAIEFLGNIILFLPFPIMLVFVAGKKLPKKYLFAFGVLTSLFIEIFQFIFKVGTLDVDDLALNSVGTFAGLLLLKIIKK